MSNTTNVLWPVLVVEAESRAKYGSNPPYGLVIRYQDVAIEDGDTSSYEQYLRDREFVEWVRKSGNTPDFRALVEAGENPNSCMDRLRAEWARNKK